MIRDVNPKPWRGDRKDEYSRTWINGISVNGILL
jgi:hypothetical protein